MGRVFSKSFYMLANEKFENPKERLRHLDFENEQDEHQWKYEFLYAFLKKGR